MKKGILLSLAIGLMGCSEKPLKVAHYSYGNGMKWVHYADDTDGNLELDIGRSTNTVKISGRKMIAVYGVVYSTNTWRKHREN